MGRIKQICAFMQNSQIQIILRLRRAFALRSYIL